MYVSVVTDTPLQDDLLFDSTAAASDIKRKVFGVDEVKGDSSLIRRVAYGLLFPSDEVVKEDEGVRNLLSPVLFL
ncbi:MAG: hypothetical protein HYZ12_01820 [Thaumarchaeota archaeon]|nr:hypothetical protein [Nitrososphaerota archaeon]